MLHREDSILINESLEKVFGVARDIERLSEFIPEFKNIRVLSQDGNKMTLEARIKVLGLNVTYTSVGVVEENRSIRYEQVKGPLKGLLTEWRFEGINEKTRLSIIHDIDLKIPMIGNLLEMLIYNLFLKGIANGVLVDMKKRIEIEADRSL